MAVFVRGLKTDWQKSASWTGSEPKWHLPGLHLSGSYITVWMVIFSFFTLKSFRSFYLYMYHFQICCLFCRGGGRGVYRWCLCLLARGNIQNMHLSFCLMSHLPLCHFALFLKWFICVLLVSCCTTFLTRVFLCYWLVDFFCPLSYLILKIC